MPPLLPRPTEEPKTLTLRRWLHLYLPLALTFILMSGSSPFINKGIGMLRDEATGLAAFANAFSISIFLYSPCFAVRDIALKFVRGRTSYRRALGFTLLVASAGTALLLLLSLTPLFDDLIFRRLMNMGEAMIGPVKRAVLAFLPIPVLVTFRGIHQSAHITNESPKWIGVGTALRFVVLVIFVFRVGVPLGMEGGVIGGLALSVGILTETLVVLVTARRKAGWLRRDDPDRPPPETRDLWSFAGPLFAANAMGVLMQPLTMAIVNGGTLQTESAAAFGVVKSFTWFFSSTLFAMQAMALARADSVQNLRRLLLFTLFPVCLFTTLILLITVVGPIRTLVLRGFFEIDDDRIAAFTASTLPIALFLPVLMALRSASRGLLMRGSRTAFVTLSALSALLLLAGLTALRPSAAAENGAVIGYVCWIGVLGVETTILVGAVFGVGVTHCVTEGGRYGGLREEELEGEVAT